MLATLSLARKRRGGWARRGPVSGRRAPSARAEAAGVLQALGREGPARAGCDNAGVACRLQGVLAGRWLGPAQLSRDGD
eukprot:8344381-Alexandrium_andersonii.AAC.1